MKQESGQAYLLDRRMVNLPRGPLVGVRVVDGLGTGSLIMTPSNLLPTTFLAFFEGGKVVAALRLPARVMDDLALGHADESLANSTFGIRAEIGIVGIGISPSKPETGEMKLSMPCIQIYKE
jgi:hypothetical protein